MCGIRGVSMLEHQDSFCKPEAMTPAIERAREM
jgi:hypothetical protein